MTYYYVETNNSPEVWSQIHAFEKERGISVLVEDETTDRMNLCVEGSDTRILLIEYLSAVDAWPAGDLKTWETEE